jgi:hypothetical protein
MTTMKVERDTQSAPIVSPVALPPRSADVGGIVWLRRWVVSLFEPLIRLETRAETERHVRTLVRDEPDYFGTFVAGVLADLVGSLPRSDPWQRVIFPTGTEPATTGSRFGTWRDATDLIPRQHRDLASDMNLAALAVPLSSTSTHLLAAATAGMSCCRKAMQQLSGEAAASESLFDDAAAAMRWAIHRRRAYMGHEDPFAVVTCVAWVTRADLIVKGRSWDEARRARIAAAGQVPEEALLWLAPLAAESQDEPRDGFGPVGHHGTAVRGPRSLLGVAP